MTKRFLLVLAAMGIHGRLSAEQKHDALHAALQAAPGAAATAVSRSAGWGLLAQAMIDAPRSLGQRTPGAGQGDFGGGS